MLQTIKDDCNLGRIYGVLSKDNGVTKVKIMNKYYLDKLYAYYKELDLINTADGIKYKRDSIKIFRHMYGKERAQEYIRDLKSVPIGFIKLNPRYDNMFTEEDIKHDIDILNKYIGIMFNRSRDKSIIDLSNFTLDLSITNNKYGLRPNKLYYEGIEALDRNVKIPMSRLLVDDLKEIIIKEYDNECKKLNVIGDFFRMYRVLLTGKVTSIHMEFLDKNTFKYELTYEYEDNGKGELWKKGKIPDLRFLDIH